MKAARAIFAVVLAASGVSAPRTATSASAPDSLARPDPNPAQSIAAHPEAPIDAADDADVTFERASADSAAGVEVTLGMRGLGGGASRRSRTLRFLGDGLDGVVRDGADDPLAGTEVGGQAARGSWRVGRAAPQWGCGWLVGAPRAPWGDAAAGAAAGLRAGPRGDVATISLGEAPRVDALVGRFAGRDAVALRVGSGGAGLMLAGTRRGVAGAGVALAREGLTGELVMDRHGRWRGEAVVERGAPFGRLALRARGGSAGFRPLLAPARGGPAQVFAAGGSLDRGWVRPRASAALWHFGSGRDGARGRLEVDLRLAQHAAWTFGVEEQRGIRRETSSSRGMRQGWWGEWRGGSGPIGLTLGVENWGRRSRARDPVRSASLAAVEVRTPLGGRLRAEQRTFRSGSGEGYRVPDLEADRLVLRALSGAGERTRLELMLPAPAGRMRAGWTLNATAARPARTQWTLDWTRRARIGGAPP